MCQELFQALTFTNEINLSISYVMKLRYGKLSNLSKTAQLASAKPGFGTQAVQSQSLCLSDKGGMIYIH